MIVAKAGWLAPISTQRVVVGFPAAESNLMAPAFIAVILNSIILAFVALILGAAADHENSATYEATLNLMRFIFYPLACLIMGFQFLMFVET